jgi:valyl-tRNA synthetase
VIKSVHPTTLLITAYQILFFWVARMIMFGCHFMQGHQQDPVLKNASGWAEKKTACPSARFISTLVRDATARNVEDEERNRPAGYYSALRDDATPSSAAMAAPGGHAFAKAAPMDIEHLPTSSGTRPGSCS